MIISIVTVKSHAIQKAIAQQYPAAISRMRVIANPIDTQIFSPPPTQVITKETVPSNIFLVLKICSYV